MQSIVSTRSHHSNGHTETMEEKEDLRVRIYKCLDRMGPYHIFLLCTFTTFTLTAGYSNTVAFFYNYTPDYYCGIQVQSDPPQLSDRVIKVC